MIRSFPRQLVLLLVASLAFAGVAYAEPAGDEAGIQKWIADIDAVWGRKQDPPDVRAKALLALMAPDFTLTGLTNDPPRTRAQCETDWTKNYSSWLKTSSTRTTLLRAHFLKPDVAFVDLNMDILNTTSPDGKNRDVKTRVVGTVVKKGGKWFMSDARQYDMPE
jgi:ketosteroid isomerase-like protein